MTDSSPLKQPPRSAVELRTPWSGAANMIRLSGEFEDQEGLDRFVERRSELHRTYIRETERTQRLNQLS